MMLNASQDPGTQTGDIKVIVGMSGGVDSSVAALLLLQQGYQVEGMFMKNWEEDDGTEYCSAIADLEDAQKVCDSLGIRLHKANFAAEYWDQVFSHFLHEYQAGRTPNPDILCNREIKFRAFLDYALALGADYIATGHYARLQRGTGQTRLLKGLDAGKDQSYFLHAVGEKEFSRCLFPVGELEKTQVRALARDHALKTHSKKDSTGICFIGERRFSDFLKTYLQPNPGAIVSERGETIGRHEGLMYYTIGQRQGLGIGGLNDYQESPWYVAAKDIARNRLVAVQGNNHPLLFSSALWAEDIHWINAEPPQLPYPCQAKVRYRQQDQACEILSRDDRGGYFIRFKEPQRAVTPGQSVVIYDKDYCLGGGVISETVPFEKPGPASAIRDKLGIC